MGVWGVGIKCLLKTNTAGQRGGNPTAKKKPLRADSQRRRRRNQQAISPMSFFCGGCCCTAVPFCGAKAAAEIIRPLVVSGGFARAPAVF